MPTSTISLQSAASTDGVPAYDAPPDGEPRGGVIVIQEAFGVNDHIEDVARRFAAEGYRAIVPHLYHRTGDPRDRLYRLRAGHAADVGVDDGGHPR